MSGELPLIELSGVSLSFPSLARREKSPRINWQVSPGDFWVVTTTRELGQRELVVNASGLQPPETGVVTILGRDSAHSVHEHRLEERLNVGIVFEEGGRTFGQLTVAESVSLPLRYHRNCKLDDVSDEVGRLLAATELTRYANCTPGVLSSSWQIRLALARALALRPKLLFLERPFAQIERRHRKWWLEFTGRLHTGQAVPGLDPLALVVVTDDAHPWSNLATQFALLRQDEWRIAQSFAEIDSTEWFHLPDEPV